MEQRAHDLHLHALSEGKLAHRLADEIAHVEELDQLVADLHEILAMHAIDGSVELEGVERREVPLQLVAIAHHQRDASEKLFLALRRHVPEHVSLARAGVEQAREHLQGGRLAGAVRAEEADDLAGLDVEGDGVDGLHLARPAANEALGRRA